MNRFLLLFFISILSINISFASIITGGVEYNKEKAAEEVFSTPIKNISFDSISKHFIDINYEENISGLNIGITKFQDRKAGKFSDGSYGIMYFDNPLYDWIYDSKGRLINFTHKDSVNFPCKITKYKPDGSVIYTGLKISASESYIYSPEGKLIAHWVNNICYDSKNNIIMTRKLLE